MTAGGKQGLPDSHHTVARRPVVRESLESDRRIDQRPEVKGAQTRENIRRTFSPHWVAAVTD